MRFFQNSIHLEIYETSECQCSIGILSKLSCCSTSVGPPVPINVGPGPRMVGQNPMNPNMPGPDMVGPRGPMMRKFIRSWFFCLTFVLFLYIGQQKRAFLVDVLKKC